ncbi:Conjugative relaxosome accessory transposon protein [Aliarcobacter thereius]|uniref:Conjugative relaxosome accessory transposon protein n=1 Tax=Aliarcobacter thereius TaxID=544718 RepID=A0A1C0B6A1_9BACT|nr:conjugal transfer protein TraH [Aliarcobacter thereius]OCL98841.1 Conjugative relaxosome accessory transposon protein [Aliarcobacter thereius]
MKRIILFLTLSIVMVYSNSLTSLFEGAGKLTIEKHDKGGKFKTEDRTILYGGGYSYRAENVRITPFNVRPPTVGGGCSGIDLTFGSLSFLNKDQFIKFAEGIIAAAPGVAFDLALKTLCPSCSETLKSLESMANEINNMSLDACAFTTEMIGKIPDSLSGQQIREGLKDGSEKSWLEGANNHIGNATKAIAKTNNWLNNLGTSNGHKSIILEFLAVKNDSLSLVHELLKKGKIEALDDLIRAAAGDLLLQGKGDVKKETFATFTSLLSLTSYENLSKKDAPVGYQLNINGLIAGILGKKETLAPRVYSFIKDKNNNPEKYNGIETLNIEYPSTLYAKNKKNLAKTIEKMRERGPLEDVDISLIGMFNFPLYKIFNAFSESEMGLSLLEKATDELAYMITTLYLYESLNKYISIFSAELSFAEANKSIVEAQIKKPDDLFKNLKVMLQDARELASVVSVEHANAQENFFKKIKTT